MYPDKEVTLIHSRPRLMPIYPVEMHNGSESGRLSLHKGDMI